MQQAHKRFGIELVQTVAVISVFFVCVRGMVQNFRVEGPSMQPTLTSGEYLWVNKIAYFELNGQHVFGGPHRGDIAVLRSPEIAEQDIDLIKRLIGLPGDHLHVQHGEVFVNGQRLSEPYIRFSASYSYPIDGQDVLVPEHEYFVLGDNRANSRDSHFGWFVPAENLVGRAVLSYWPPADWGLMPSVAYATR